MMRPLPYLLAAAVAAALAPVAARADDDTFAITISAFRPTSETQVSAYAPDVMGQRVDFEDSFDLAKERTRPRVDGMFRIAERHRILFNYYNLARRNSAVLDEDISFDGQDFSIDTEVTAKFKFSLATLSYEYAFVETPKLTVGGAIGVHWAEAKASIAADDETLLEARTQAKGGSPAIGLRFLSTPNEQWRFGGYVQAFKANISDIDGQFVRAGVLAEYRFLKGVGVQLGYDWFNLDADYRKTSWNGNLDLTIRGPHAGMTFAF
ncbi:hypothetical protein ACQQ2N_08045 [Dokdonella sp. MW10]|uniref:hypothetical protein n=1 Tax=Dokdonella sp. MW10 TaxID=2992926 RepID=UPI003F7E1999